MRRVKLANVLLQVEDFLEGAPEALYRAEGGSTCSYDEAAGELEVSGLVDFTTYFNGVSVGKWRRYANVGEVFLHVELAGDACVVAVRKLSETADGSIASDVVDVLEVGAREGFAGFELPMPADAVVAGFALMTEGNVRIRDSYYYTEVDEARIRSVRLALCTTTFRKEDFIVPNIARIKAGVLGCDEPIADSFHLFVVDNGRTLDAAALSDEHVTVIANPNVGGSGGFARGMMAAQDHAQRFTHVILMDDDVRMSPESFKRAFALLSLVNDEFARACINGAMLELERPWLQYEDVAYVRAVGGYNRVKNDMRITDEREVARNELIGIEPPSGCRLYGAWWFSCIPMQLIEENGLPVPFFVRCDDVEYGVRLNTAYMTMNGICVWHARFAARFNAAVACYQYVRNMFAMMALHGDFFDQRVFLLRYWRTFHHFRRTLDYDTAGLWLDGLEDYLKGPAFIMSADGAALVARKSAQAEKLVPVSQLEAPLAGGLAYKREWLERGEGYQTSALKKVLTTIPHDRHWLPDFMLNEKPGVIAPGYESYTPWQQTALRSRLVAMSPDEQSVHVREIDRARYRELTRRYGELMERYRKEGAAVAEQWRASLPELSSREFWAAYIASMAG